MCGIRITGTTGNGGNAAQVHAALWCAPARGAGACPCTRARGQQLPTAVLATSHVQIIRQIITASVLSITKTHVAQFISGISGETGTSAHFQPRSLALGLCPSGVPFKPHPPGPAGAHAPQAPAPACLRRAGGRHGPWSLGGWRPPAPAPAAPPPQAEWPPAAPPAHGGPLAAWQEARQLEREPPQPPAPG